MQNSIRITIFLENTFLQGGVILMFPCYLARTIYEVEHPWCLSSHGEFFVVSRSNYAIFLSTRLSPTREQFGEITALYVVTIDIYI